MERRSFIKNMTASAAVLSMGYLGACQTNKKRPNILFIFSDDHAYQAISAYKSRLAELAPTPNIDRLANEGMLFQKCYVTNSICAPSRASIITGKHSHLNGVLDNRLEFDGSQQTFPKLLQSAGYKTAIIGKWHLKSAPTGFDYWQVLPGQGAYYNPDFRTKAGMHRENGYVTDIITDKALNFLKEHKDAEQPFLLMMQHKAPHREWEPALRHLTHFDDVKFPEPDNLFDDYSGRGTAAKEQDMSIEKTMRIPADLKMFEDKNSEMYKRFHDRMTEKQNTAWNKVYDKKLAEFKKANLSGKELVSWKYQRYMQDYLGCIKAVDESMGKVLDYLDESGLAKNTIVIYNSDQGFYLGEHGWFDKRFMYEESYKTPLLVRWPKKVAPKTESSELVSNLDFAQTFLDIAGAPEPEDMQGISLKPLLTGQVTELERKSLYYHYYEFPAVHSVNKHEGVATKRYKLMHFYELDEWELYDLDNDPNEMTSVYDDPEYKDIVVKLKAELIRLKQLYKVPAEEA